MTTLATIKQLEKRYDRLNNEDKRYIVVRHITQDDKLIDQEGYLLSKDEIKRIEKEDEELTNRRGMAVYLTSYSQPKIRPA